MALKYQIVMAGQRAVPLPDGDRKYEFIPGQIEIWQSAQGAPTEDCEEECYTHWLRRNMPAIRHHIQENWVDDWDRVILMDGIFPEETILATT